MKLPAMRAVSVIMFVGLLLSCGGSNTPESVTRSFVDAMAVFDFKKASRYVTDEGKDYLKNMIRFGKIALEDADGKKIKILEYEISDSRIDGDQAWVTVSAQGESKTFQLVRVKNKWALIYDMGGIDN